MVDDGSTDGTVAAIESGSWPFQLKVVHTEKNSGVSHARNVGIDTAQGKIIVFSDSDMIVPSNYLEEHWKTHEGEETYVVSAPYRKNIFTLIYPGLQFMVRYDKTSPRACNKNP